MPRAKKAPIKLDVNTGGPPAAKVPTGLPYGGRSAALTAEAAVPIAGNSGALTPLAPQAAPPGAQPPGAPAPADQNQLAQAVQNYQAPTGNLLAPSQRPSEPVTAGLPSGPGPGPGVLPTGPDVVGAQLRALYAVSPSPDILRLIELHDLGT